MEALLAFEKKACATGTAWGLLAGAPLWQLILFWCVRHAVYATLAIFFVAAVPQSVVAVSVFFLFVHGYKGARFLQAFSAKGEDEAPKEPAAPPASMEAAMVSPRSDGLETVPL